MHREFREREEREAAMNALYRERAEYQAKPEIVEEIDRDINDEIERNKYGWCDKCGLLGTASDPLIYCSSGQYGQSAFEGGEPEHWYECVICTNSNEEVPY